VTEHGAVYNMEEMEALELLYKEVNENTATVWMQTADLIRIIKDAWKRNADYVTYNNKLN
jgi:hypothetical protein